MSLKRLTLYLLIYNEEEYNNTIPEYIVSFPVFMTAFGLIFHFILDVYPEV